MLLASELPESCSAGVHCHGECLVAALTAADGCRAESSLNNRRLDYHSAKIQRKKQNNHRHHHHQHHYHHYYYHHQNIVHGFIITIIISIIIIVASGR